MLIIVLLLGTQKWAGTKVYSPSKLRPNDNVIICTTSYKSVVDQLHKLGIKKYKISPILDDYVLSDKIEDINFDLLIASGLPSSKKKIVRVEAFIG